MRAVYPPESHDSEAEQNEHGGQGDAEGEPQPTGSEGARRLVDTHCHHVHSGALSQHCVTILYSDGKQKQMNKCDDLNTNTYTMGFNGYSVCIYMHCMLVTLICTGMKNKRHNYEPVR